MNLDTFSACFYGGYDCAIVVPTQLFLWSRYSDTISLLTITVRGYHISIAYCFFNLISHFFYCILNILLTIITITK